MHSRYDKNNLADAESKIKIEKKNVVSCMKMGFSISVLGCKGVTRGKERSSNSTVWTLRSTDVPMNSTVGQISIILSCTGNKY